MDANDVKAFFPVLTMESKMLHTFVKRRGPTGTAFTAR